MPRVQIDIEYEWYRWAKLEELLPFARRRSRGPIPARPGVYEIRRVDSDPDDLLYIGFTRKLTRLYDELSPDTEAQRAKKQRLPFVEDVGGDTRLLALRWAEADECYVQALECELVRQYIRDFGRPPKYVRG